MINLVAASLTDPGLEREENEDNIWVQVYQSPNRKPIGLFVVCDGMGGHMGGGFASYWAVEAIKHEFADLFVAKDPRATLVLTEKDIEDVRAGKLITPPPPPEPNIEERVWLAIQKANNVVYEYAKHKPMEAANAGTTVTLAGVYGSDAIIANAGDGRAYLLRDQELIKITRDHSLVANMVSEGYIQPDEVYSHPQRNVIYRFLGQKGLVYPDIYSQVLQAGDYLILCSDGLWEMVRNEEIIVRLVQDADDPAQACQALVDAANEAGGEDNISVVVVKVSEA